MPSTDPPFTGYQSPPWIPALAGRYDEVREVGRGGMGIVYKARDRQTGDVVALKVLRPELSVDTGILDRFKSELLLARRITHKNVCRVYELVDLGAVSAISMEFVEGESLRTLLKRHESLSVRFGMKALRQILAGLAEAHARGVIHRDLKPENILIGSDGSVKLMDFGIARASDSRATSTGTAVGTPAYMSPEQVEGHPADARSDIYSLGLVMYEMFCGQPAFSHPSPVGLLAKQAYETPAPPRAIDSDVPVRLERTILKCLEKDPAKRFQSVSELEAALLGGPAPTPVQSVASMSSVATSLTTWQRRDGWLVLGAVIGALTFVSLFEQTSLAAHSQVTFDRGALRQIIQQYAARLRVTVSGEPRTRLSAYIKEYGYLLRTAGGAQTRTLATDSVPLLIWKLNYADGPSFHVDARGRLLSFARNGTLPDSPPLPVAEARSLADGALREFFNVTSTELELEREGTVGAQTTFSWIDPQASYGLVHRYVVVMDSRGLSSLSNTYEFPPGLSLPLLSMETWYTPISLGVVLLLAVIGLRQRHRVELTARWRVAFAAVGFLAAFAEGIGYLAWGLEPGSQWSVGIGVGFTAAVLWLLMSAAAEDRVRRIDPARLLSMVLLFGSTIKSPLCGLSLVRGAFIGLTLLGLDAAMVWLVITHLGGQPDPDMFLWFLALGLEYRSLAVPLAGAVIQMLWIGVFVSFAGSVALRHARRRWVAVAVPAIVLTLLGAHFSMASVQPYYWTMAVLLVNYLVLVFAFQRYDLLTLFSAIFTFAFVWGTYMLYVALQQSGAGSPTWALIVWALLVIGAGGIAFQNRIRAVFGSVSGALD